MARPLSSEQNNELEKLQQRYARGYLQAFAWVGFPLTPSPYAARENSNETLVPPKPKELLITASKSPVTFCRNMRRCRRRRRPTKIRNHGENVCSIEKKKRGRKGSKQKRR